MSSAKDFLRRLAEFLRKVLGQHDHDHPVRSLVGGGPLTATVTRSNGMAKVALSLPLPNARADGTTASAADVSGVTFESKLKSAPVTAFAKLGPDVVPVSGTVGLVVNNVPAGLWTYRATVHDKAGGADLSYTTDLDIGVSNLVGGGPLGAAVVP